MGDRTDGYVVEHRSNDRTQVLALGTPPLAPLFNHLRARGETGDLVVVAPNGQVVIRWSLNHHDGDNESSPIPTSASAD